MFMTNFVGHLFTCATLIFECSILKKNSVGASLNKIHGSPSERKMKLANGNVLEFLSKLFWCCTCPPTKFSQAKKLQFFVHGF